MRCLHGRSPRVRPRQALEQRRHVEIGVQLREMDAQPARADLDCVEIAWPRPFQSLCGPVGRTRLQARCSEEPQCARCGDRSAPRRQWPKRRATAPSPLLPHNAVRQSVPWIRPTFNAPTPSPPPGPLPQGEGGRRAPKPPPLAGGGWGRGVTAPRPQQPRPCGIVAIMPTPAPAAAPRWRRAACPRPRNPRGSPRSAPGRRDNSP